MTNWTVREMSKFIVRRDPTRPSFLYMSFNHPHPPLAPLAEYLEMYQHLDIDMPFMGEWARDPDQLPHALRARPLGRDSYPESAIRLARQAFYALCTHVDHQIRLVIGLLREEGLLDDTIIMFTCDHGDMLGNHGLYAKKLFYEHSAKIPMVLMPQASRDDVGKGIRDDRLAIQADVFPTLMELCDIPVPPTVEGLSLIGERGRDHIYGLHDDNDTATRMVRDRRHKLIYYPAGNVVQLFDLDNDPDELRDVSDDPAYSTVHDELTDVLIQRMYGDDRRWTDGDRLIGMPAPEESPYPPPRSRPTRDRTGPSEINADCGSVEWVWYGE